MYMEKILLGRTELLVTRSGFGVLPLQRVPMEDAVAILRSARDGGINFFDTARSYTDSEEKLGAAFGGGWGDILLATKSQGTTAAVIRAHMEMSLRLLKKGVIDVYQLHNPARVPGPGDEMYDVLREAQKAGLIRFIGITAHKFENALSAARSGWYDTVQYPLSCLSTQEELAMVTECARLNIGVIAMKAMAGGLLPSASLSMAYLRRFENLVPIWGVQRQSELDEILALEQNPPALEGDIAARIEEQRASLVGNYCRGCGYCLPCPANIPLHMAARMPQFIRRSPWRKVYEGEWPEQMLRIERCVHCGQCAKRCPYGLDPAVMIVESLRDWREYGRERGVQVP